MSVSCVCVCMYVFPAYTIYIRAYIVEGDEDERLLVVKCARLVGLQNKQQYTLYSVKTLVGKLTNKQVYSFLKKAAFFVIYFSLFLDSHIQLQYPPSP